MSITTRKIEDEYEAEQLNPSWSKTKNGEASHEQIENLLKAMPEETNVKMRLAVFEVVLDDVIDDAIDEADGKVDEKELMALISPIAEKAVTLHLAPSLLITRLPHLVAKRYRRIDPRVALLAKAAMAVTDAVVTMKEEDTVVSDVLDDDAADIGFDVTEETVEPSGDTINVDGSVPTVVEQSMRLLAAGAVNARKATALVSRTCSGVMLGDALHQLRNHLPEKFLKKYGITR